jgi:hypothetical protein
LDIKNRIKALDLREDAIIWDHYRTMLDTDAAELEERHLEAWRDIWQRLGKSADEALADRDAWEAVKRLDAIAAEHEARAEARQAARDTVAAFDAETAELIAERQRQRETVAKGE